jgi:hypothetical protein
MTLVLSQVATVPLGGDRLLVGRERERRELACGLQEAIEGRGSLFMLAGEPGIGKTMLIEALAAEADASGARTVWGRCWEGGGAPAFWPWLQVLGHVDPDAVAPLEDGTGTGVAPAESASARLAVFRRVSDRLAAVARRQPLLLALDDLHAASAPSLLLLRFLARELPGLPVLAVGAFREAEGAGDHRRAGLLEALAREGRRLPLRGLGEAEVARIVEHRTGQGASLALVRRVHGLTEGNPLFVEEVARVRAAEMAAGAIPVGATDVRPPRGVRDAICGRLDPLPAATTDVLSIAAVVGREFDMALLADLGALPAHGLSAAIEAARVAGVIEPVGGADYRFAHGLMREEIYRRLAPGRRAELHLDLARRIQSGPDVEARVYELAHHLRRAVPSVEAAVARSWSMRAARRALDVLAYEEAAAHAAGALDLGPEGRERAEMLLVLGEARMAAGEVEAARVAYVQTADAARALQEPELLAAAALGLGSGAAAWAKRGVDAELVDLLEEASALLAEPSQRAGVLARLAEELMQSTASERVEQLSSEAVALARAAADDAALTRALPARLLATLTSASVDQRAELIGELRASAERSGSIEAVHSACLWGINQGLERGDRVAVEEARGRLRTLVRRTRQPHQLWSAAITEGMLALLDGRLAEAERSIATALSTAEGVVSLAPQMHGIQLMTLRREQGRLAELEPAARDAVAAHPASLSWRCALIGMLCETGREADARREMARLPAGAFQVEEMGPEWVAVALLLVEACARLGERERAAMLYAALSPYAGQVAVASFSVLCRGAVDRYLGLLAGALGRVSVAERHFDAAQGLHAGLASALWSARTEADRARVRADGGERAGARAAAETALALAEDRGLVAIATRARAVLGSAAARPVQAAARTAAAGSHSASDVLVFRREGQLWTIGDPAAPLRLPDSRGLGYIAELLTRPGQEQLSLELAGALSAGEQPVLDAEARAAYSARVDDLRAEVQNAERFGDPERASRAGAELEVLAAELGRAVGLRGRDRRLAGPAERARSSVTKAIRSSIRRIAKHDPTLAGHLDGAVRTGTYCVYRPDPRHPMTWQVTS